jgi:hypothetical protein
VSSYLYIYVLILLHIWRPHTSTHLASSYCYISSVLILLHMCAHTATYVSAYGSIRQHTSAYVSIRQHTHVRANCYICVRIQVRELANSRTPTAACRVRVLTYADVCCRMLPYAGARTLAHCGSGCRVWPGAYAGGRCMRVRVRVGQVCVCVLILLRMCPHPAAYVSSYCCVCVLILLHICPYTATYVCSSCCICVLILLDMCPHTAT